jgi:hypothetical protein
MRCRAATGRAPERHSAIGRGMAVAPCPQIPRTEEGKADRPFIKIEQARLRVDAARIGLEKQDKRQTLFDSLAVTAYLATSTWAKRPALGMPLPMRVWAGDVTCPLPAYQLS